MREPITPAYLDLVALAQYTCLSVRTWRDFLKRPDAPPHIRVRGKILLARLDVDEFFAGLKQTGPDLGKIVDGVIQDITRGRAAGRKGGTTK